MFAKIAAFEFRFQTRQPSFYVSFLVFFLLVFFAVVSDNVRIGGAGAWFRNSPFAVMQTIAIMSIFGIFFMTMFMSRVTLRDFEHKTAEIIFSTRITKSDYLLGRFTGAFGAGVLAFMAVPLAVLIGSVMPWLDPETVGPLRLGDYLYSMVVFMLPNLFFIGALFFAISTLTRSTLATYGAVVGFLILYFVTAQVFSSPEMLVYGSLLDPFGLQATGEATRYWTTFDRNILLVPLDGLFLINRLIWSGLGLVLVVLTVVFFRFETTSRRKAHRKKSDDRNTEPAAPPVPVRWSTTQPAFGGRIAFDQFVARMRLETRGVVHNAGFMVILALGVFNTLFALVNRAQLFGTDIFPVTRVMLNFIAGSFSLVIIVVVIYYTAELVWRERQLHVQEIVDAAPVPNWAFVVSKLFAMFVVIVSLFVVAMITAIGVQLFQGYTELELGLYAQRLFLHFAVPFYLISVLSIFVQVLVPNKFLGMLIMVVYLIATQTLSNFGFEHNLYQFAGRPASPLSDMNGYGHFLAGARWFGIYWGFFSLMLAVGAYLLWNRGTPQDLISRIRRARTNYHWPAAVITALALIGFVASGGYIYYNTNIINHYVTQDDIENAQIAYEQKYKKFEGLTQPRITGVKANVDIFPYQRRYRVDGRYVIENRSDTPIDVLHLSLAADTIIDEVEIDGGTIDQSDKANNYYIYKLSPPMAPGEKRKVHFKTRREDRGFKNSRNASTINFNGTFFNNTEAMPYLGYDRSRILTDRKTRRQHGLEPVERMPKLEDVAARRNSYLSQDSYWVTFEAVVSTVPSQTAIAPGYLQREWMDGGRHYFDYKMDAPIQNFFSFLSAEYARADDKWKDVDIAIYYYPLHKYNVQRMIEAVKASLDYYSTNFSPYQYRQLRILEFPAYARFAQSFPNTVPYSEAIGFIADIRDKEKIDYVYYITAHETAHQWWGHQVMGANTQGGTALVETLAQYSALMVMEKTYGRNMMRRFLKFELDNYLRGRGGERDAELPLYKVENQPYIHYRKGSIVMYAIRDALGEAAVNRALANLIREKAYAWNPYPTSLDLIRLLRAEATTEAQQNLITDLFEHITLWDFKARTATVTARADGRFDVTLSVDVAKFEADGKGQESEKPMNGMVDIGLFTRDPAKAKKGDDFVILLEKRRLHSGKNVITLTVDKRPLKAGIDPYNKLIDRNSNDNLTNVEEAAESSS